MGGMEMLEGWIKESTTFKEKKQYLKVAYDSRFITKKEYKRRLKELK